MFHQGSQTLLDAALPEAFDGRMPHRERLGHSAVFPPLCGFEEDAGAGHFAGRVPSTVPQEFPLLTFIVIKCDKIF